MQYDVYIVNVETKSYDPGCGPDAHINHTMTRGIYIFVGGGTLGLNMIGI